MAVDLFLDSLAISRTFKPPSPQTGGEYFDYLEEQSYFPVVNAHSSATIPSLTASWPAAAHEPIHQRVWRRAEVLCSTRALAQSAGSCCGRPCPGSSTEPTAPDARNGLIKCS